MPWDAWALISITALCGSVLLWSWWGFHVEARTAASNPLRLATTDGSCLEVPRRDGRSPGRHRRSRHQTRPQPRHLHQLPRKSRA